MHRRLWLTRLDRLALLVLFIASGGCDPDPPTGPCESTGMGSATSISILDGAGRGLTDGDFVTETFGPQGGSHWGFRVSVIGSGFGDCLDVSLTVGGSTSSGGFRARTTSTGASTSEIPFSSLPRSSCITATATGYGLSVTRVLATGPITCGPDTDGGVADAMVLSVCGDGIVEGDEECDVADPAICNPSCRFERCDGVVAVGEACFEVGASVSAPVDAMAVREAPAGVELAVVLFSPPDITLERRGATDLAPLGTPLVLPDRPLGVVSGDFDGDGMSDDIAMLAADGHGLRIALGDSTGDFTLGALLDLGGSGVRPRDIGDAPVAAADLDADGDDDVFVGMRSGEFLLVEAPAFAATTTLSNGLVETTALLAIEGPAATMLAAMGRGSIGDELVVLERQPDGTIVTTRTTPAGAARDVRSVEIASGSRGLLTLDTDVVNLFRVESDALVVVTSEVLRSAVAVAVVREGRTVLVVGRADGTVHATTLARDAPLFASVVPLAPGIGWSQLLALPDGRVAASDGSAISILVPGN